MIRRLRTELLDLVELVLLPSLGAFLPWKLAFAVFRKASKWEWLYADACRMAQHHATSMHIPDAASPSWRQQRRLVTIVDHADHYLGLTRSDRWITKHMKISGNWYNHQGPLAMITFHWGAGYWGLRHAAAYGIHPHALMASLQSNAYQGRSVLFRYAKSRNTHVERVLCARPIDVANDLRLLAKTLRTAAPVLGVVDVPADDVDPSTVLSVQLLGRAATFRGGLLRRLAAHRVPVVLYITGLNTTTGNRTLHIESIPNSGNASELATAIFNKLDQLLAESSAAWHFWSEAPRIFQDNRT